MPGYVWPFEPGVMACLFGIQNSDCELLLPLPPKHTHFGRGEVTLSREESCFDLYLVEQGGLKVELEGHSGS